MARKHPSSQRRYRCRYCGAILPAWLPAAQRPDGAMLFNHLSAMHPDEVVTGEGRAAGPSWGHRAKFPCAFNRRLPPNMALQAQTPENLRLARTTS
jgi:hypothetical protein